MKPANIRKSIRITFEEAVFGCKKELEVILKIHVRHVAVQVQNREHHRRLVRNVAGKVRSFIPVSPSSERYKMYRPVRIVVVPVR